VVCAQKHTSSATKTECCEDRARKAPISHRMHKFVAPVTELIGGDEEMVEKEIFPLISFFLHHILLNHLFLHHLLISSYKFSDRSHKFMHSVAKSVEDPRLLYVSPALTLKIFQFPHHILLTCFV
jgi:hypothetical protein